MRCREVRERLLAIEDPRSIGPREVVRHLDACPDCRRLAERLAWLEAAWREAPAPESADRAKNAFLARLSEWDVPKEWDRPMEPNGLPPPSLRAVGDRPISRRHLLARIAGATAATVATGAGLWTFLAGPRAEASAELVDRLLDWNLLLSRANSPEERGSLYAQQASQLRATFESTRMPDEQATLARTLLDDGDWLSAHPDPVGAADRFDGMADRLLELARKASEKHNHRQMNRLLEQYGRVIESGVNPSVAQAEALGSLDFEHQKKLERLMLCDAEHVRQLAALLERAPDASRKQIRRVLNLHKNQGKKRPNRKGGKKTA
jgi:hypothetical protein